MPIQWNQSLAVGIEEIDNQHKEIFRLVSDLTSTAGFFESRAKTEAMFGFLQNYVRRHFYLEEQWMASTVYPNLGRHIREHDVLTSQVESFISEYAYSKNSPTVLIRIQVWLNHWLIHHIGTTDQAMGVHLKSHRTPTPPPMPP